MPAYDERAEQSVLGSILINPKCFGEIEGLRSEHFFIPTHGYIFDLMQRMHAEDTELDAITIFAELDKEGKLAKVGGAGYLHDLLEAPKSPANIGYYAKVVMEKWKLRTVNDIGTRLASLQTDDIEDIPILLERAHTFLDEIDAEDDSESADLHELYDGWLEWQADDRPFIETPFLAVNDLLNGGMVRQRMLVVGARPGCGKTVFVSQLGFYAALQHLSVLMFSMELSKNDLMSRIIAMAARVPYKELNSRRLSAETRGKVSQWISAAQNLKFEVDDRADLTIEEIMQKCRIHKQRHGLDVVVIDYIQEVEESRGNSREQAIAYIAKRARQIAKKLDVVVIVAAQLNRNLEDPKGKPRLPVKSDFRESGGIENVADVAMILSRTVDKDGNESKIPKMNLTFVKNRQGEERTIQLLERFDQQRFDNIFGSTTDDMRHNDEAVA
ncbi:DnaB-like helicase [Mycobacterium phage Azrael100]|nr:DnaB-like helicase [Mycobacterium phage Azrael100]